MTQKNNTHPDLLRRFVPIPYRFDVINGTRRSRIESNDLELALRTRSFCVQRSSGAQPVVALWKLLRDTEAPVGLQSMLVVNDGPLRTLHLGRGTILVYDREKFEFLGFIAPNVSAEQLVVFLLPTLIGSLNAV
jgi:hypothetical protein